MQVKRALRMQERQACARATELVNVAGGSKCITTGAQQDRFCVFHLKPSNPACHHQLLVGSVPMPRNSTTTGEFNEKGGRPFGWVATQYSGCTALGNVR